MKQDTILKMKIATAKAMQERRMHEELRGEPWYCADCTRDTSYEICKECEAMHNMRGEEE